MWMDQRIDRQTDRQDEANSPFSQLQMCLKAIYSTKADASQGTYKCSNYGCNENQGVTHSNTCTQVLHINNRIIILSIQLYQEQVFCIIPSLQWKDTKCS